MNMPTGQVLDLRLGEALIRVTPLSAMHRTGVSFKTGQSQSAARHLKDKFIQRFLAEFARVSPEQIVVCEDPLGRRTLEAIPGRARSQRIDFSVAYGTGVLAVGASETTRIGLDIETTEVDFDFESLVDSFFAPAEREEIFATPRSERLLAFLRVWTAKEAYVKAIGHGLAFGLSEIETAALASNPEIRRVCGSRELAEGWKLIIRILTIAERAAVLSVVTGETN